MIEVLSQRVKQEDEYDSIHLRIQANMIPVLIVSYIFLNTSVKQHVSLLISGSSVRQLQLLISLSVNVIVSCIFI